MKRFMTREQQKRRRNEWIASLCWAIVAALLIALCVTTAHAAYDGEALKTGLAGIGAFTVSGILMRFVCWLDTSRR